MMDSLVYLFIIKILISILFSFRHNKLDLMVLARKLKKEGYTLGGGGGGGGGEGGKRGGGRGEGEGGRGGHINHTDYTVFRSETERGPERSCRINTQGS